MLAVHLLLHPTTGDDRVTSGASSCCLVTLGSPSAGCSVCLLLPLTNMSHVRALISRCGWLLLLIIQMLATASDLLLHHHPVNCQLSSPQEQVGPAAGA